MNKKSVVLICLLVVITSMTQACGSNNNNTLGEYLGGNTPLPPQPTYQYIPTANSEIVFAGKVVSPNNGEWTNNRLVLAFLKSKEIARVITSTTEYTASKVTMFADPNLTISASACMDDPSACGINIIGVRLDGNLGISDGIFVLRIPNTYELNLENLGLPIDKSPFVDIFEGDGQYRLGTWIDPFNEGDTREFYIPSKNMRYVLKVLPGDISQLPAEIQQPGSVALMEGNRLVAVDPNAAQATPESNVGNDKTSFTQTVEDIKNQSPEIYSYNNCSGSINITHEITSTNIQEITDTTGGKFGIELPVTTWLKFVANIEKQYSIKNQEIKTNSITLVVPPKENIEFSVVKQQTWVSGVAILNVNGVDISEPYKFLKNEKIDYQQQKLTCP